MYYCYLWDRGDWSYICYNFIKISPAQLAQVSSTNEIINKTDYDLPWGKYEANSYRKDDQEVINNRLPKLNIEESQTLADGRVITLLTNKIPLFFNKEVVDIRRSSKNKFECNSSKATKVIL